MYRLSIFTRPDASIENKNERNFQFSSGTNINDTYSLLSNLYLDDNIYPAGGVLNIIGANSLRSVIDGAYYDENDEEHNEVIGNYSMFIIKNNRDVEINISKLTIKNIGAYPIDYINDVSVAYLDEDSAKLTLNNVTLSENQGYALYNNQGLITLQNVNVLAPSEQKDIVYNEIMNKAYSEEDNVVTGGLLIKGGSTFNTKITNEGLMVVSGNQNIFKADVANVGTIRFGGTSRIEGTEENPVKLYNGQSGSGSNGTLVFNGTFTVGNYSTVESDQNIEFQSGLVNVSGGTLNMDENDIWSSGATIKLDVENSVLNYSGIQNNDISSWTRGKLLGNNGTINLLGNSTLYVVGNDQLADNAIVNIKKDSTLYIMGHPQLGQAIILNSNQDDWSGNVTLNKSYLIVKGSDLELKNENMLLSVPDNADSESVISSSVFENQGVNITVDANQDYNGKYI